MELFALENERVRSPFHYIKSAGQIDSNYGRSTFCYTPKAISLTAFLMTLSIPIPLKLKVVAYLLIIEGAFSIIEVAVSLLLRDGVLYLDFGVIYFFIGRGLLKLNSNAHKWAVVLTILHLIAIPIAAVLVSFASPGELKILGRVVGDMPPGLGSIFCVLLTCYVYWQYSVLSSMKVKRLFSRA